MKKAAILSGFALGCIFTGSVLIIVLISSKVQPEAVQVFEWWERAEIYHIYVPSFFDSDGDGYGDFKGIKQKIDYIQSLGVNSIWLSPFYESGGADLSFDVLNHCEINPLFGNKQDLIDLLEEMWLRKLHVILSFIPNHTSKKSEWFVKSEARDPYFEDFYVWRKNKNNWTSTTGESAWTFSEKRQEWYLHHFLPEMPDLNLRNPNVQREMKKIIEYWLKQPAVYGLQIASFNLLVESFDNSSFVASDVEVSLHLLDQWKNITNQFYLDDGFQRLIMIEMVENKNTFEWQDSYRNEMFGHSIAPFSFGNAIGNSLIKGECNYFATAVQKYIRSHMVKTFPKWEIGNNNHISVDSVAQGRTPPEITGLAVMLAMLLPGSVILYYGDEIGMTNNYRISFEDTVDPYARPPYANESTYQIISRDPSRTPMQWTAGKNSGFTTGIKPWLPIHRSYKIYNVEAESKENSVAHDLRLYKKFLSIRKEETFFEGHIYFPYQDYRTFTFMRKSPTNDEAFLIIGYLESKPSDPIDFSMTYPDFPHDGIVVESIQSQNSEYSEGDIVDLCNIVLQNYDGLVIKLLFRLETE